MRAIEIEDWARRVIDRVERHSPNEDIRVELKERWPESHNKAARQIAGHCNASAGDLVLWLIGVSEDSGVVGVNPGDMAAWWPQVRSQFDHEAPYVRDVVLSVSADSVVALVFETDRVPFVVRNAAHGTVGGGPVAREVPWREGTAVRSATRSDLLRLLLPASELPSLEFYSAEAALRSNHRLDIVLTTYAVVSLGAAVVVPDHQAYGDFQIPEQALSGELTTRLEATSTSQFRSSLRPPRFTEGPETHTVHQGDNQVILDGPGFFRFIGTCTLPSHQEWEQPGTLQITFGARPAGSDLTATLQATLPPHTERPEGAGTQTIARWRLHPSRRT